MHFIITRLLNFINTTPKKDINYKIASYLLSHLQDMEHLTIYDIAEACYVSPASVSRFAKILGYRSFSLLKEDALEYNSIAKTVAKLPQMNQGIHHYIEQVRVSLDQLEFLLDQEKIDQLVEYLIQYDSICLLGIQFSGSVAMQMQSYLNLLHKQVEAPFNIDEQLNCLVSSNKDSLIILFTARGNYHAAYLESLIQAKQNGAKIIVITQNQNSNLVADLTIFIGSMDYIHYSEYNMYLMMSYIVYCYHEKIKNSDL